MKNTNKRLFAGFFCLVLVIGALLALTACGECKEHSFGEWETVTAATCTTEGERRHTCTKCKEVVKEAIPALGHDEKTEVTTAATCTTDGVQKTTCQREGCDYHTTATIPALGHDEKTEVTTAATCTAEGVETTTCQREGCDYRVTSAIEKLAHTPDREKATCEAAKTCTACGAILEAKTVHVYKETVTPATCTTAGYTTVTCEHCDYRNVKDRTTALGHNPGDAATCQTEQTCTRCNAVLAPKAAHNYVVEVSRHAADCEHDGSVTYKCEHCDATAEDVNGFRLGHDVGTWEEISRVPVEGKPCVFTLTYKGTCSRGCGEVQRTEEKTIHEYNLVITAPATCMADGEKTPTCVHCGATGTPVPYSDYNAHRWSEGTQEGNILVKTCMNDGCTETKRQYTAADQTAADLTGDAKTADSIQLKDAELALNEDLKSSLPENTKLTAETLDEERRNQALENVEEKDKNRIGDNPIYNFGLTADGSDIAFGENGRVTVTVPYSLGEGEDPESIVIFYVDGAGKVTGCKAAYANGYATFVAEHFSYYTVARLTPAERCQYYDHTYIEGTVDATCTTDGYTFKLCRRCGEYIREITEPAFGHEMDDGVITPATCVANGKIVYSCNNEGCTFHVEKLIPKSGHNFAVDAATSRASTCTVPGHAHYVCQNEGCDAEYSVPLPVAEHTILSTTVPVTCTTDGYTQNTCSVCGFTYRTGERAALGHSMTETVVPATCTEDGYTLHACRSCDYAYRTDTVAKHHTFDIAEPTCGQGQTCTLCGAKGLPATGNHTMVNGVCSVCGQGCTHDYDEKVVAPTCTESGYTEKTCKICNKVIRENYTAKLGHDYKNGVCTRCDDRLDLTNLYYQINRSLMTEKYTFLAKNVRLVVIDKDIFGGETSPNPPSDKRALLLSEDDATAEVDPDISLSISGELYFGFDENGDLYGYMVATVAGTVDGNLGNAKVTAMIRGGKVYFAEKSDATNASMEMVGVVDLVSMKNAAETSGPSATADMLLVYFPELLKWYEEEVLPVLLASADGRADEIAEAVERFLTAFFKMEDRAEGGYAFTFDFDKLHALNDNLATLTVSELVDFYFGEGTFAAIKGAIPVLFDMTIGDILDAMEADGLSADTLIDLVNSLIVRLKIRIEGTEITSLDMLISLIPGFPAKEDGTPYTLKELLKDETLRSTVISDIILNMVNEKANLQLTKETVLAMANDILGTLENQTLYHYIASMMAGDNTVAEGDGDGTTDNPTTDMTEEELEAAIAAAVAQMKDKVDMFIEAARSYVSFSFTTDERGVVQGATLNLNVDIPNIGSLIGELSVVKGYHSTVDLDEAFKALEDIRLNPHSADGEDDIVLTFDEEGKLVSVKSIYGGDLIISPDSIKNDNPDIREEYDAETGKLVCLYPESIVIRYTVPTVEATYPAKNLMMWAIQKDCGDWRSVMQNYSAFESHYLVTERTATFKASDIEAFFKGEAQPVDIIADYAQAILFSDYERTTEQVGQQEVAEDVMRMLYGVYYTPYGSLAFCYNVTTNAVKNRSTMHDTELTYEFATEGGDCEDGVTYTYTCKNCNAVTSQYKRTGHDTTTKFINASELGHKDCPMYITYKHCSVCGKDSGVEINNAYTTATTDDAINAKTTLYRCYNENCTFVVEEHVAWEQTGCVRTERYTYTVMSNTETIKEIKYTMVRLNHTDEHTTYTLVDGATSCEDGVVVNHWCDACGFQEEHNINWHATYLLESYDLAKYGSKCGGTIEVWTCACGEEREWHDDIRSKMHEERESELETGNCTYAYSLHCSVTDCAYAILFKTIRSYDAATCTATDKKYAYLERDKDTGKYENEVYLSCDIYTNHDTVENEVWDPVERTHTVTDACKYCDHRRVIVDRYKTDKDYKTGNWYESVETTYYSERDNTKEAVYTVTSRRIPFDESDPRYQILSSFTYYYRNETLYRDGERYYQERGVELSEDDPCIYRVYENDNGNRIEKDWESFHDSDWMYLSQLFSIVEVAHPASCTQPGEYALECRFCHTRINPFARRDVFNATTGMTSDFYYEATFAWAADENSVLPYNNRYTLYVSATSYDEEKGTFLMCSGHSYEETADGSYVCKTCGLKNYTGYDDVCILEDCSNSQEEGFLAARYIALTNYGLMPKLSLVLTATDGEGSAQTMVIYFGGGYEIDGTFYEDNLFTAEFDDSAYVTVNSDKSLIVINWAGVREFIAAHAGDELKKVLASDGVRISCRLNIVPIGGMEDLECAITFE